MALGTRISSDMEETAICHKLTCGAWNNLSTPMPGGALRKRVIRTCDMISSKLPTQDQPAFPPAVRRIMGTVRLIYCDSPPPPPFTWPPASLVRPITWNTSPMGFRLHIVECYCKWATFWLCREPLTFVMFDIKPLRILTNSRLSGLHIPRMLWNSYSTFIVVFTRTRP